MNFTPNSHYVEVELMGAQHTKEVAQRSRVLTTLIEDANSVPSTLRVTHNCPYLQFQGNQCHLPAALGTVCQWCS